MPLRNNTIGKRMDEMSEDIETQHVENLKSRYFSLKMYESTQRESEVVLLAYARYIDKGEFVLSSSNFVNMKMQIMWDIYFILR